MSGRLIGVIRAYLNGIERGDQDAVLACFLPGAVQVEWPNRIKPAGAERGLAEMMADFKKGMALLASQSYEISRQLEGDSYVVVELTWRGRLAVPLGSLAAGAEMVAHSAIAFDFEGDKILAQRNYDCFEPF